MTPPITTIHMVHTPSGRWEAWCSDPSHGRIAAEEQGYHRAINRLIRFGNRLGLEFSASITYLGDKFDDSSMAE